MVKLALALSSGQKSEWKQKLRELASPEQLHSGSEATPTVLSGQRPSGYSGEGLNYQWCQWSVMHKLSGNLWRLFHLLFVREPLV